MTIIDCHRNYAAIESAVLEVLRRAVPANRAQLGKSHDRLVDPISAAEIFLIVDFAFDCVFQEFRADKYSLVSHCEPTALPACSPLRTASFEGNRIANHLSVVASSTDLRCSTTLNKS